MAIRRFAGTLDLPRYIEFFGDRSKAFQRFLMWLQREPAYVVLHDALVHNNDLSCNQVCALHLEESS